MSGVYGGRPLPAISFCIVMSYDVYSANEAHPKLLCTRLTYLLKRLSINISEIGPQSLARGYHDLRVKPVQKITVKQKLL